MSDNTASKEWREGIRTAWHSERWGRVFFERLAECMEANSPAESGVADVQGTSALPRRIHLAQKWRFAPIEGRMPSLRRTLDRGLSSTSSRELLKLREGVHDREIPRSEGILPSI